ncbi:hypothetical protein N7539_002194 [Penicillium diatomitis]|uniref:Uncharacterized protein n=1 Tax=Penicillium diatomitis TaxID=2819901 RepID=A0A9X0C0G7_9EURO|nr:uncharacterized protein N7539_002194 [Penicillium diatomitis]KAJ5493448.1 hypothetical protein N7539_002194 [Penicillium diatomitis]
MEEIGGELQVSRNGGLKMMAGNAEQCGDDDPDREREGKDGRCPRPNQRKAAREWRLKNREPRCRYGVVLVELGWQSWRDEAERRGKRHCALKAEMVRAHRVGRRSVPEAGDGLAECVVMELIQQYLQWLKY